MTVKTYDLGEGASLTLHSRIGRDMLVGSAVFAQISTVKKGYPSETFYQDRFSMLCSQCDKAEGLSFAFPDGLGEDVDAQAAYEAWLHLPGDQFDKTLDALRDIDSPINSKEMISPDKAGEKRKSPLPKSEGAKQELEPVNS